jgi:hypothetical protein
VQLTNVSSNASLKTTPESIDAVKVHIHSSALPIVGSNKKFSGDVQSHSTPVAEIRDLICQHSVFGSSSEVEI